MIYQEDTVQKYTKRPVEIEAVQWAEISGIRPALFRILDWIRLNGGNVEFKSLDEDPRMLIQTLEGTMTARPGDWIIRGIKGEFYPCKDDIFTATYVAS